MNFLVNHILIAVFTLLQMNWAICCCNTMLANLHPLTTTSLLYHSVLNLIKRDIFSAARWLKYPFSGCFFFKPICIFFLMTPSLASPFTVLHDIQLCPCRADKAVGHQGSSRWRLVTRPWCFLRSSKMLLKWAELTAESFNYFQVTEKCHRQKNSGDLPKGPLFNQPRSLCVHI